MPHIIQAHHLRKTFTSGADRSVKIKALDDLSIDVHQGEVLGILGPNGAGKTTFLNVLATLLTPDSGDVVIAGIESKPAHFPRLHKTINMASGYPNLPFSLTVEENLRFYGRLYGLSGKALDAKLEELISLFELTSFRGRRFDELSSGNKQRLALAKSLLNDPQVIFLDEPTVGLDPDVAIKMRAIIKDVLKKRGVTVLLTTHNMDEAEEMCDRVAFIKGGRIVHLSTPAELKASQHSDDLEEVFVRLAQGKGDGNTQPQAVFTTHGQEPLPLDVRGWFNRCLGFTFRNYIFAVRNFFSFVELLFWPMVGLVSIGLMGAFLKLDAPMVNFIMSGAIAAGVLQVAQLDVSYSLLYEVWSKSVKQTLLTPVGVSESLFGSWVIGIVRGLVVFAALGICAVHMFNFHFPGLVPTVVFLCGMFMCAMLLGMLVTTLILSFGSKAEITAWMFAYLFMLLCGIYYPVDILPPFAKALAQTVPVAYFLEYFRHQQWQAAAMGLGLTVFYFMAGWWLVRLAYTRARRKGIIVRLSE